ncbi:MAG: PEP-utilizing enzyme [Oligoflexia bacterium]|nr:PEP-utilizing enzyme [Oligoflexia bacterium]
MSPIWLPLSEDTCLPSRLTGAQRSLLGAIFDVTSSGSPWRRAIAALGLPWPNGTCGSTRTAGGTGTAAVADTRALSQGEPLLSWPTENEPLINWTLLVATASAGSIEALGKDRMRTRWSRVPALLFAQWRLERYLAERLREGAPLPETNDDKIVESLALGLAVLALTLRLPAHDEARLAAWLATPSSAPFSARATLIRIQALQRRRSALSPAWREFFPSELAEIREAGETGVPRAAALEPPLGERTFKGLPVCTGEVEGRLRDGEILVFAQARPETAEIFVAGARPRAVLYAQGGVLSHACTLAREAGIPCVTGLGPEFLALTRANGELTVRMDGATGEVTVRGVQ